MTRKLLRLAFLISVFMITANQLIWAQSEEEKATIIHAGQQAPDFTYTTPDGTAHSLHALKGKVVLITFFATWCGPCNAELPHIQKEIYDQYKNNPNFKLLVIGREHTNEQLKAFQEKKGFHLPMIADPQRKIYSLYAKGYIPRNFLINKEGKVIYQAIGFNDKEFSSLKQHIQKEIK